MSEVSKEAKPNGIGDWIYNIATDFATEQRGWFVLIFVLPFSLLFDVYYSFRAWAVRKFYSAPKLHEQRVKGIQAQIKQWREENKGTKLCTARGGWQSISPSLRPYKQKATGISINLYDILEFDDVKKTIRVEPMVNMGMISHFLIPKGYTIPVLPEMDDLTVGGLMMGVGIETSSHKYGLFNDTVIEAEIILADGSVVKCSKEKNSDLFDALPWSYGTLGFLASVTIQCIPCKPYVRVEYIPCENWKESTEIFQRECLKEGEEGHDFVEALMYTRDKMVIMPARFVDASEVESSKMNSIGLWYKPWFYKHVEGLFGGGKRVEYIPLRHYFHRHTKSIFWELEEIIPIGNHPLFRFLFGWAVPPKVSFLKLTQTAKIREIYEKAHVIQDMLVPFSKMDEALDVFEKEYGIYPLWICPYRAYDYTNAKNPHRCFLKKPKELLPGKDYEMYVDLGAYGIPRAVKDKQPFDIVKCSRTVEKYVHDVHGFQMLYATSYMDRDEFRQMFDHTFYDQMKKKYDPTGAFPEVYAKVCKKAMKLWDQKSSNEKKQD
mmetsp:Transcript_11811/g.13613  ORF Transcript_11811/g.13613 Transcript_11811/m.13613 type:complete len:548 (+) Transcript_11811:97-1740(+)|eukprot:CAMPEP_0184022534 /NCGR_PEP_ID=MMETSP0954-20121128/10682_1 /TAXON_ID=627963 /ORGANISM="Aplanochytrium sp, Strain PBS07" /LENGTH=547 /DNA_ID=CAMNT_0026304965 /DNA_START=74 /DNA_END=1717 /DNA_ORIENTATION=-